MRNIQIIAKNTALELIRNRVLYTILFFAVAIIVGSESISHFGKETQVKLMVDISFTAVTWFSVFLSLFLTMEQVPGEIERKTVYFVLTRPVHRFQFLAGKFLGVTAILFLNLAVMGAVLAWMLHGAAAASRPPLFSGLLLVFCQSMILTSVVICLSTFMSSILAVTFALFLYFFGSVSSLLLHGLRESGRGVLGNAIELLRMALPNFDLFDIHDILIQGDRLAGTYTAILVLYALLFSLNFLIVSSLIFSRRDL